MHVLEMTKEIGGDLLEAEPCLCDGCGRQLDVKDDRQFCATCHRDYCSARCCTCSGHELFQFRGFPMLEGPLEPLLAKAEEYLHACCGGYFQVNDGIYVGRLWVVIDFLRSALQGLDPRTVPRFQAFPSAFSDWVSAHGEHFLRQWVALRAMGRFVDYFDRRAFAGRLPSGATWLHSQGGHAPVFWRGLPMMKTVWDFGLYPIIIQEVQPRTIIELGTASGASAVWYADLQRLHGLEPNVTSLDVAPPPLEWPGVTFVRGDCNAIGQSLTAEMLVDQPRPWLVVDDAHVNIPGVLDHFHPILRTGDYLVIEDVDAQRSLVPFIAQFPDQYKVDTRYTDFFGHNATCARDQIFRRTA